MQRIQQLSLPIILPNITVPLISAVDVALIKCLNGPVFIRSVRLSIIGFNLVYFEFGFLRTGNTSLVAQILGTGQDYSIVHLLMRGVSVAYPIGECVIQPLEHSALGDTKDAVYSRA